MASCSPPSRWRWRRRPATRDSGARRSRPRVAALTKFRFRTGASSGNANAARNVALEVHAHLRALSVTERIEAVVAVPADLDASALMVLRGALSAAGVDTRDFLDSATLTAAAVVDRSHYVLLDAGWRSATATRVSGGAECIFEEAFVSERANLLDVYDLWLIAVAGALVKNTRFDPLLSLDVEQRLFADLPMLAARAATEGKVEAVVESEGARFAVPVDAQLFADAAQPFYRELTRLTRNARIAGQDAALVLPAESRRWPGFLPRLLELEQDGLVIVPAGIAAVAASLQAADPAVAPRLRRRVARVAEHSLAADIEYVASASTSAARALPVTHILFGGDSMRFPDSGPGHRHRRSRQRSAHRAAARRGRRVAPPLFVASRRRAHGAHRPQPLWHLGQRRARARTRRGASRRSRARRHAGRRVHAHLRGGLRARDAP